MERMFPKVSHEERSTVWHALAPQHKAFHRANKWGNVQHLAMPLWELQRRLNADRRAKDNRNLKDKARRAARKGKV